MVVKSIKNTINYWYFRYLMVTELYMVEKWERAMFHIVLLVSLTVLYLFNTVIMLGLVRSLNSALSASEYLDEADTVLVNNNYEL